MQSAKQYNNSIAISICTTFMCEPCSLVSIVSVYRLDDQAIEVRSLAGPKDFSCSLCVQTGTGTSPASCTMATGVPFPVLKRGQGVMLTTHPHLVPRSWMSRSYTSCPPKRLHGVWQDCFTFFYYIYVMWVF
jgi:hypothetical protein